VLHDIPGECDARRASWRGPRPRAGPRRSVGPRPLARPASCLCYRRRGVSGTRHDTPPPRSVANASAGRGRRWGACRLRSHGSRGDSDRCSRRSSTGKISGRSPWWTQDTTFAPGPAGGVVSASGTAGAACPLGKPARWGRPLRRAPGAGGRGRPGHSRARPQVCRPTANRSQSAVAA